MPEKQKREGVFDWLSKDLDAVNRLTLEDGEKVRLMVLDEKVTVTFSHLDRESMRSYKRCGKMDKKSCEWCESGDLAVPRYGCMVVVYRAFKPQLVWEVIPWLFGRDKLARIREHIKSGVKLNTKDLYLVCYNAPFQKLHINVCDYALWDRVKDLKVEVLNVFKEKPTVMQVLNKHVEAKPSSGKRSVVHPPAKEEKPAKPESSSPVGEKREDIDKVVDELLAS